MQLMAEEKRRAKMMEKMKEREETLKHMQNYGMGGDGECIMFFTQKPYTSRPGSPENPAHPSALSASGIALLDRYSTRT